jgi:hypothetical protein
MKNENKIIQKIELFYIFQVKTNLPITYCIII